MMDTILKRGSRGEAVRALQKKLSLYPDGIFGPLTEEGVKAFQKANGLAVDGLAGPKTLAILYGAEAPAGLSQVNPRRIDKIILHCSATPEGEDFTVDRIRDMHIARGFSDIGYHYIIYRDGTIHEGRPERISGAHTAGCNSHSIGICYIGGCPPRTDPKWQDKAKDTRTPAQKAALRTLVASIRKKYPAATIHGHYEFANKACPSFKICDL